MKGCEFVGGKLKIKGLKIKKKSNKKKKKEKEKEKEKQEQSESNNDSDRMKKREGNKICTNLGDENEQHNNIIANSEQLFDLKKIEDESLKDVLDSNLTNTEKVNKLILKKREKQRIEKLLKEGYRQRLQKFNDSLAALSEHFDIPKVGPG